jgi:hypothetical protein
VVKVEEQFLHCAKAFKRSKLWDPTAQVDRKVMPSIGRIILDQVAQVESARETEEAVKKEVDEAIEENYRTELY